MSWETPVAVLLWMIVGLTGLCATLGIVALSFVWGSGLYAMHREGRRRKRARPGID